MAGDRSLAFVIIGSIVATMLWIGTTRMSPRHAAPAIHTDVARTSRVARPAAPTVAASKPRLVDTPPLTPLD
jgi:hypothetical protein